MQAKDIFNLVMFYLVWWGTVWAASRQQQVLLWAMAIVFLAVHLGWVARRSLDKEIPLLVVVTVLGSLGDYLFSRLGLFEFTGGFPVWIPMVWLYFAATLRWSFRTALFKRWICFAAFFAGPLSYATCIRWDLISYEAPVVPRWIAHGFIWVAWIFVLRRMVGKIDARSAQQNRSIILNLKMD